MVPLSHKSVPISVKIPSEKMTTIAINWSLAKCSCRSWSATTDEAALRSSLASLDDCSSSLHWWLGFWTFLVALGVVLEVVFVVWEYLDELHDFRRGIIHAPDRPQTVLFVLGLLGAGLVAAGVSGELWKESQIATVETCIRKGNDALFLLLSKEAGDAKTSAKGATDEAQHAKSVASGALNLARTTRSEAALAKRDVALAQKRVVEIDSMINILAKRTVLRALDREQCVRTLKGIPKGTAEIWYEPDDIDASMFAAQIYECLGSQGAGWLVTNIRPLPEKWESSLMGQASRLNDARISASETGIAVSGRVNNSPPASPLTDPWSVLERAVNANGTVSVFSSEKIVDPSLPEGHFVIVVGHQQGSNVALPTPSWELESPHSSAPQQK